MKKIMFVLLLLLSTVTLGQINTAVLLTAGDSYDVVCLDEWTTIAVYDTGDADTVTAWFPYTNTYVGGGTTYASIGKIMDLSTGANDTVMAGDADTKYYTLWIPYPRAVRFTLSAYASGDVEVKAIDLP